MQSLCKLLSFSLSYNPVSYTHLDVYKRQEQDQSNGRTPMEAITLSRQYLKEQGW